MTDHQKRDHAVYFKEKPDDGFSPERNKQIIERSIKKYEAVRKAKQKQYYEEDLAERVDAAATYLRSLAFGKNTKSVEKYFGKRELARLRSQKILSVLQERGRYALSSIE